MNRPYQHLSFDEMHALRTYSVLRSHRTSSEDVWEKVEATGLTWGAATELAEKLSKAERALHPDQTCWVRDTFERRCEQGDEINAELQRRRTEQCTSSALTVP
jgi:hypothetical protein